MASFRKRVVTVRLYNQHAHSVYVLQHDNNKTACGELAVLEEPTDGFFLLHSIAVEGDRPNNHLLSTCSIAKIGRILSTEVASSCFTSKY